MSSWTHETFLHFAAGFDSEERVRQHASEGAARSSAIEALGRPEIDFVSIYSRSNLIDTVDRSNS
jgi:hypothetical protein